MVIWSNESQICLLVDFGYWKTYNKGTSSWFYFNFNKILILILIFYFNKIGFNVFYVLMKGVSIIRNFKQPIYETFD